MPCLVAQTSIGKQLKQVLDLGPDMKIGFGVFQEKLQSSGKGRDKYSV
jgi:hypothetical protein